MSQFTYVELVENHITNRNKVINIKDYVFRKVDYVSYMSVFMFSESVITYIQNNIVEKNGRKYNSIENYDGDISSDFLYIDIDSKNLNDSLESLLKVITELTVKYDVTPNKLHIYYSGKKGFHIAIKSSIFGATGYCSKNLNVVIKEMVRIIVNGTDCVDYKIYDKTRIFRTPFSRHQDTHHYKIPVDYKYITGKNLDRIQQLSTWCADEVSYLYDYREAPKLTALFMECRHSVSNPKSPVILQPTHQRSSIFTIPEPGNRNDMLFKQAFRLYSAPKLNDNEVLDIMKIIYELTNIVSYSQNEQPVDLKEFEKLLNSAMRRSSTSSTSKFTIQAVEDMTVDIFKFIQAKQYVPINIDEIDYDLSGVSNKKGGLNRKKSYSIIGKYGTKKSIITMNWCIDAGTLHNQDSIYVNGEMDDVEFFKRCYQFMTGKKFADMIDSGDINNENIEHVFFSIREFFANKLAVINKTSMNVNNIRDAILLRQDTTGQPVHLVVVDSMDTMFRSSKDPFRDAIDISHGLKETAKETETAIVLINHVTQACTHHFRDTSIYVRGGGQVIDNCDGFFCTSLVIDEEKSNMAHGDRRDVKYLPDLLFLRFNNKRGSGRIIDKVLRLDDSLRLQDASQIQVKDELPI